VTVLIGGNEQGKTSVLRGVQFLDRDAILLEDDLTHRGTLRNSNQTAAGIPIVTGTFEIPIELRDVLPKGDRFSLCRYADGHYELVDPPQSARSDDSEGAELQAESTKLEAAFSDAIEALQTQVEEEIVPASSQSFAASLPAMSPVLDEVADVDLHSSAARDTVESLLQRIAALDGFTAEIAEALRVFGAATAERIRRLREIDVLLDRLQDADPLPKILAALPRFVYFRTQDLLEDEVALSELDANAASHPVLRSLLNMCGLNATLLSEQSAASRAQATSSASTTISGEINSFWRQANVGIHVHVDGPQLIVLIDEPGAAPLRPSQRSDGFQWFLSFYIALTDGTRGALANAVLLLDDPGVYLHASGQGDLLGTLERLAQANQIAFATHSPFLIDRQHLERVRIVEKTTADGTQVIEKFWTGSEDALAPIRASIGMSLGQSLFSGSFTVAVEGLSDSYLIQAFAKLSSSNDGPSIDFDRVSILPVGGAQARYMVPILAKESVRYVVLLDSDSESEKTMRFLREEYGISDESLCTLRQSGIAPFGRADFEIEDLIAPEDYLRGVNTAFRKILRSEIDVNELNASGIASPRIIRRLEKCFRDRNAGSFDKIRAALAFREMVDSSQAMHPPTIENARKLTELIAAKTG
jgi:hypothetical protein